MILSLVICAGILFGLLLALGSCRMAVDADPTRQACDGSDKEYPPESHVQTSAAPVDQRGIQ